MRPAIITLSACLLTAAAAVAQPAALPAAAPLAMPPAMVADPAPVASPVATEVLTADPMAGGGRSVWASAEYLVWFNTPMNTPGLIQSVPAAIAAPGQPVPAGFGSTLFPNTRQLQFNGMNGLRVTAGTYFDRNPDWGFDVGYYTLETKSHTVAAYNNGFPNAIGEQFFNANNGTANTLYLSLANQYVGGLTVTADTQTYGAEANVRYRWFALFADRTDLTSGFRYHDLSESLGIGANSIQNNGTTLSTLDVVRTHNQFYGKQIGLVSRFGACDRGLGLDTAFKMALGGVHQTAQVFGSNTIVNPGLPADSQPFGLYSGPANTGTFTQDKVAFLTDLKLNLTYNFNPRAKVFFGYSLIWLSNVARPGEILNPAINPSMVRFIQGTTPSTLIAPTFRWNTNDYWVQGLNFGGQLTY